MSGMQRRTFLGALAGLIAAPAVVKAAGIMPVVPIYRDDSIRLQRMIDEAARDGRGLHILGGDYKLWRGVLIRDDLPSLTVTGATITKMDERAAPMIDVRPSNLPRLFERSTFGYDEGVRWPEDTIRPCAIVTGDLANTSAAGGCLLRMPLRPK